MKVKCFKELSGKETWVVLTDDDVVLGVGSTEEEALQSAREKLDGDQLLLP